MSSEVVAYVMQYCIVVAALAGLLDVGGRCHYTYHPYRQHCPSYRALVALA